MRTEEKMHNIIPLSGIYLRLIYIYFKKKNSALLDITSLLEFQQK